jgi:two-component system, OmpR family, sensor histidine kinase KdpD
MAEGRVDSAAPLQIVAAVAHEMQTPLAAVRGAARALIQDDKLDPAARRRLLAVIEDGAAQLAHLAEDLTLAGRLEAGKLPLELVDCDLASLVDAVVAAARSGRPDASVEVERPAESSSVALADPERLRRALAELVENALKHTAGSVRITISSEGKAVRIRVHDDGPGIANEERERIFEPYVRLGERAAGSGLGLAIARDLVRAMGGELAVNSQPGQGSTFTIELQAA